MQLNLTYNTVELNKVMDTWGKCAHICNKRQSHSEKENIKKHTSILKRGNHYLFENRLYLNIWSISENQSYILANIKCFLNMLNHMNTQLQN